MMEFNPLHPTHILRERGWKPEPNPFMPKPIMAGHRYADKHIFIYAAQLWYDIDAQTSMLSRSRRNMKDENGEQLATSENTKERPLFYRWFDMYLRNVESTLQAYVMKPNGRARGNELKEWDEQDIWLRMPDYWDDTRYEALAQAIHNYLVAGAMYEYLKLTLTSKDPLTVDKKEEVDNTELAIIDAANATKAGAMVHTLKPFG